MQSYIKITTITDIPTLFFYRMDVLPVAQPTVSKHWRGKTITFHVPARLKLARDLPTLSLTTKGSSLLQREDWQASHQPTDTSTPIFSLQGGEWKPLSFSACDMLRVRYRLMALAISSRRHVSTLRVVSAQRVNVSWTLLGNCMFRSCCIRSTSVSTCTNQCC